MKKAYLIGLGLMAFTALFLNCSNKSKDILSLKNAFNDAFYIGAALNLDQIWGRDKEATLILKQHFSSIVAENCMKGIFLQPVEGEFYFKDADKFVELGEEHNMFIIGHTLIWHTQAPEWFFTDKDGKEVSKEILIERMKNHITTIVGHYKGRVKGWDVVNEAILDDGSLRRSKFYEIIGEDFIRLAFEFTHAADPDAELYYNDYSMAGEGKRNGVIAMVKRLQEQGVKIDGIGMQGHLGLEYPEISAFEKSIMGFSSLGVKVMITELDISVLPTPKKDMGAEVSINLEYKKEMNPYTDSLPEDVSTKLQQRYIDFFRLFLKHRDKISRVTVWGISDKNSWKNDWPMKDRTDYPLLFDREYKAKSAVGEIIKLADDNTILTKTK